MIRQRTLAGKKAAKQRERKEEDPRKLDEKMVDLAKSMLDDKSNGVTDVCKVLRITKSILYRYSMEENDQ